MKQPQLIDYIDYVGSPKDLFDSHAKKRLEMYRELQRICRKHPIIVITAKELKNPYHKEE